MADDVVRAALDAAGVKYCLIGAHALSAWGFTRYTADIDYLTLDHRVLTRAFWPAACASKIKALRRGDEDDPLAGVARFKDPAIDIVVGRGRLVREAIETAVLDELRQVRVATPLCLSLLKLEAGSPSDVGDVFRLIETLSSTAPGDDLVAQIVARVPDLSDWGKRAWGMLEGQLGGRRGQLG